MHWYQYLSLICLGICLGACLWHFFYLIRLGRPKDFSKKSGNIAKAEVYAYTKAMMPNQKESAYLHIPTFTSGLLFHIGTFLSLLLFIDFFFVQPMLFPCWLTTILTLVLIISAVCGLALFIKRIVLKKLRSLSNLDDYISNFLTTIVQIFTLLYLLLGSHIVICYYVFISILLLYIPVGKLRHVIYFFAARYHLGFFYGWRNTWPPKNL